MMRLLGLLLSLAVFVSANQRLAGWPKFRYSLDRQGRSPFVGSKSEPVFSALVSEEYDSGLSGLVSNENGVYAVDADNNLVVLSMEGERMCNVSLGRSSPDSWACPSEYPTLSRQSQPAVAIMKNSSLLVVVSNEGRLALVDGDNCTLTWIGTRDSVYHNCIPPTVDSDGVVFVVPSSRGDLDMYSLQSKNTLRLENRVIIFREDLISSAPAFDSVDGTMHIVSTGGVYRAFKLTKGMCTGLDEKVSLQTPFDHTEYASPSVWVCTPYKTYDVKSSLKGQQTRKCDSEFTGMVYVPCENGIFAVQRSPNSQNVSFYSLDGKCVQHSSLAVYENASSVVVVMTCAPLFGTTAALMAVDGISGEMLWVKNISLPDSPRSSIVSSPNIDAYGIIYVTINHPTLFLAVDILTGDIIWSVSMKDDSTAQWSIASPIIGNNSLLVYMPGCGLVNTALTEGSGNSTDLVSCLVMPTPPPTKSPATPSPSKVKRHHTRIIIFAASGVGACVILFTIICCVRRCRRGRGGPRYSAL